jgi:hypothetical protein
VANIVPENSFDVNIGKTDAEKADNLYNLVQFLTGIVEVDLSHIKGRDIVFKKDEISAKHLLELILELINILKNEQDESMHTTKQHETHSPQKNQMTNHYAISSNSGDNLEEDNKEEEYKEAQSMPNIHLDYESTPNKDSDDNSNLNLKENYSQNDITRYEKVLQYIANNEEYLQELEKEQEQELETRGRSNNPSLEGFQNVFRNRNLDYRDDESKSINISHISEVSRSKENSEPHSNQKGLRKQSGSSSNMIRNNESDVRDTSNLRPTLSKNNINNNETGNKTNKYSSQHESYVPSKLSSIEDGSYNDSNIYLPKHKQQRQAQKESIKTSSSKNQTHSKLSNTSSNNKNKQQQDGRMLGRAKSQRQLMNEKSYTNKSESNTSNKRKSQNSIEMENTESQVEEDMVIDDNLKYEVIKEFRRIYGNKLDRLFLKDTANNSNGVLDQIMKSIRLARNKMKKMGIENIDPDDLQVRYIITHRRGSLLKSTTRNSNI